jgi:hypothetical protein
VVLPQLLEMDVDQCMTPKPQAVLDTRMRNKKPEQLIHWQGLSPIEATWEDKWSIHSQFPNFFPCEQGKC